jgi:hypothetical protein
VVGLEGFLEEDDDFVGDFVGDDEAERAEGSWLRLSSLEGFLAGFLEKSFIEGM